MGDGLVLSSNRPRRRFRCQPPRRPCWRICCWRCCPCCCCSCTCSCCCCPRCSRGRGCRQPLRCCCPRCHLRPWHQPLQHPLRRLRWRRLCCQRLRCCQRSLCRLRCCSCCCLCCCSCCCLRHTCRSCCHLCRPTLLSQSCRCEKIQYESGKKK